jgi:hypothetical protein
VNRACCTRSSITASRVPPISDPGYYGSLRCAPPAEGSSDHGFTVSDSGRHFCRASLYHAGRMHRPLGRGEISGASCPPDSADPGRRLAGHRHPHHRAASVCSSSRWRWLWLTSIPMSISTSCRRRPSTLNAGYGNWAPIASCSARTGRRHGEPRRAISTRRTCRKLRLGDFRGGQGLDPVEDRREALPARSILRSVVAPSVKNLIVRRPKAGWPARSAA